MTILVTGAGGLLGTALAAHDVVPLTRKDLNITDRTAILQAMNYYRPEIVINCAGVVPKTMGWYTATRVFEINAAAPRYLVSACDNYGAKLVQISTDCVFDGKRGGYDETDFPTADTTYGLSKMLGEVDSPHLTIRTSFVGLPDWPGRGLLAWAHKQTQIVGYDKVYWNGLGTKELARKIMELATTQRGILHLHSPQKVSKYELLLLAKDVFNWDYELIPESEITEYPHESDKSLDSLFPALQTKKPLRSQLEELDA